MFPDASDLFWGCCGAHAGAADYDSGTWVEQMQHHRRVPDRTVHSFRVPLKLATVDEEDFAIAVVF